MMQSTNPPIKQARRFYRLWGMIFIVVTVVAGALVYIRPIGADTPVNTKPTIKVTAFAIAKENGKEYVVMQHSSSPVGTQPSGATFLPMYQLSINGKVLGKATLLPESGKIAAHELQNITLKPSDQIKLDVRLVKDGKSSVATQTTSATVNDLRQRGTNIKIAEIEQAKATSPTKDTVTAPTEFGPLTSLGSYMEKIMKYALPLGIALATLSTIYGGIVFMLSQGQPDKIKDGQEIIQGAVVGLIVLILARLLATYLYIPSTFEPTADEPANPLLGLIEKDLS